MEMTWQPTHQACKVDALSMAFVAELLVAAAGPETHLSLVD